MSKTHRFLAEKTMKLNEDNKIGDEWQQCKLQQIYESEKLLFLKTKMRDLIKKEWNEGTIYSDFKGHYEEIIGKNDNANYFWITINPQLDITLEEFKKVIEKYILRTFIKSYIYVYEQRASENNNKSLGEGLHCHLLIERDMAANVSPYDIQKRTRIAFKNVCNSENKSILYFKQMPEEYIIDKFNYITNKNLDEEHKDKEEKQEYDKKFREKNDLKEYYASKNLKLKYIDYIKCLEGKLLENEELENPKHKLKELSTIQEVVSAPLESHS